MEQASNSQASAGEEATLLSMTPAGSINSGLHEASRLLSKDHGCWTEGSTHAMDDTLVNSTQSSYFGSSGVSSGLVVNQTLQQDTMAVKSVATSDSNANVEYRKGAHQSVRLIPAHGAQDSVIFANANFFEKEFADGLDSNDFLRLFDEPKLLAATDEGQPLAVAKEGSLDGTFISDVVYLAQPQRELEIIRRSRARLANYFEAAVAEQKADLLAGFMKQLAEQKDSLESCFEERYDSTAKLHDTNMLNLQDDHDAVVKDLKLKTKDQQARLAKGEKTIRDLKRELKSASEKSDLTKTVLQDRSRQCNQLLQVSQERETILQRQKEELHHLREELARTRRESEEFLRASQDGTARLHHSHGDLTDRYNALLTGFNHLNSNRQSTEARLEIVQGQLETSQAALQARNQDCEDLRARHDHVVAEKTQDFSWNIEQSGHPFAMKPTNLEDKIAEATEQLGERLQEQTAESADLRRQLESALATRKSRVKKLKRVVANQNQENVILEMALSIAQEQREHWAEQYDEIAEAVTSKLAFSSFARGLGERHLALQKTRFALEAQLLESKIRGDRATLKCEIQKRHEGIKLEKRDAEIAALRHQLGDAVLKYDNEHGMVIMFKDMIDQKMPELRDRNTEVERLLQDQITNNVHADHQAVFDDVRKRVLELEGINQFWEHEMNQSFQKHNALQTAWGFFSTTVYSDLTNARSWRNELDRVELENVTLRERFAAELLTEPLVIPEHRKTRQQIEDDFKLENIDDLLLEQFGETWGAVRGTCGGERSALGAYTCRSSGGHCEAEKAVDC